MNAREIVLEGSQLAVIVFSSLAVVHILTQLDTSIQIGGVPAYYYLTHFLAIILLLSLYPSVHKRNHPGSACLALFSSIFLLVIWLVLASIPFLPFLGEALPSFTHLNMDYILQLFPIVTFAIATAMGTFSAIVAPSNRGKCFVIFLIALALPAIFAESMVDWRRFFYDMITVSETYALISPLAPLFSVLREMFILLTSNSRMNQLELYAMCFGLLAGYIVLRYATRIALTQQELSNRGASASDTASISHGVILIAALAATSIVPAASAAIVAPLVAPYLVSMIQPLLNELPESTILLGIGMGTIALATSYIFTKKAAGMPLHKARGRTSLESDQAPLKEKIVRKRKPYNNKIADVAEHRLPDPLCLTSVLLGIVLLSAGSILTMQTLDLLDTGVETDGIVVELSWKPNRYNRPIAYPVFEFVEARTREEIRVVSRLGGNPPTYSVGQEVHILYDPQDPQNVIFVDETREDIRLRSTIIPVSGVSFLAIGSIYYGFYVRKRRT